MSGWIHLRGTGADKTGQRSTIADRLGEINILDCLESEDLSRVLRLERGIPILGSLRELNLKDCLTPVIRHVETGLVKEEYWVFPLHLERVDALGFLIAGTGDLIDHK